MRSILSLFRRGKMDRHLDAELHFQFESKVRDCLEAGLTEDEARRQARLSFGGIEQVKEDCRDARPLAWVDDLRQDLVFALRSFRRNPAFTAVALIAMAL